MSWWSRGRPPGSLRAVQRGGVLRTSCKSGADFVGSVHLGLKTCPRVCAAAFTRRLMLNLPYLVSPALLLGPWLISVPFPQRLGAQAGPRCTESRCLLLIRDERCPRDENVPGQTTCKPSLLPGSCHPPSVLCFGASSPGPEDQGWALESLHAALTPWG